MEASSTCSQSSMNSQRWERPRRGGEERRGEERRGEERRGEGRGGEGRGGEAEGGGGTDTSEAHNEKESNKRVGALNTHTSD